MRIHNKPTVQVTLATRHRVWITVLVLEDVSEDCHIYVRPLSKKDRRYVHSSVFYFHDRMDIKLMFRSGIKYYSRPDAQKLRNRLLNLLRSSVPVKFEPDEWISTTGKCVIICSEADWVQTRTINSVKVQLHRIESTKMPSIAGSGEGEGEGEGEAEAKAIKPLHPPFYVREKDATSWRECGSPTGSPTSSPSDSSPMSWRDPPPPLPFELSVSPSSRTPSPTLSPTDPVYRPEWRKPGVGVIGS